MPALARWSPILLALTCSCSEPSSDELVGDWITAARDLEPAGYDQAELSLRSSGSFRWVLRSYGLIPAQNPDELSASTTVEGTFRTENDQVIFHAQRLVTWDRFYGADSPPLVQDPYPYGELFDQAHYQIVGSRLMLNYVSYPADGPVPTQAEFDRKGTAPQ